MKNRIELLELYRANTGQVMHEEKQYSDNPYGYQIALVREIQTYDL